MSRRRTGVVLGIGVSLLLAAGTWGLVMLRADATHVPRSVRSPDDGPLTPRQYSLAVRAAERAVDVGQAHLRSATAVVRSGSVHDPNQGGLCGSGQLIEIRLIGRFPQIGAHHLPGGPSRPVTSVEITADGTSGRTCRLELGVDKTSAYRHAADLLPALTR